MSTLSAVGLHAGYPGRPVLSDINVTVRPGRVASIIGPNGAGKTTLLKCLAGILAPSAGQILVDDRPLSTLGRRDRAATIAYVPQAEPSQFPTTVFDMVLLGRRPYLGWAPGRTDLDVVASTIDLVGIGALAGREMHQLSGGERQLVGIAKAIAQDPRVLLLDEPTTYLDLEHQLKVLELLGRLAERDVAVIMSIHDLNHALASSDEIVVLRDGVVVASGPPTDVDARLVEEVYGVACDVITHRGKPVIVAHRPPVERRW